MIVAVLTAACGAPPPLKSNTYLKDTSLLATGDCTAPCFHGITPGKTTFTDAVTKVKADQAFSNIQSQDKPPQAGWSTTGGEACCQMTANDSGVVDAVIAKVTPDVTLQQVIDKFGQPQYAYTVDYSSDEVAVAVIFPEKGVVVWVSPGNPASKLTGDSPVVIELFIDPAKWSDVLSTATLQAWAGFQSYQSYKSGTPVVTPRVTPTPGG